MRIAVACDGLNVAAQASGCASFTCYAVNHGIISGCCNVPNMGITIFESVETLCQIDTDVLIAGSFDEDIRAALAAAGIEPAVTALAAPQEAADAYLHATLMGETGLEDACASAEPLDELDDAFARIEYKLVAQSA